MMRLLAGLCLQVTPTYLPHRKKIGFYVVDTSKLKLSSPDKMILGSGGSKLAIVKSVNVDEQIKAY